jgi:predicted  nucleic acid-binding Zn-ribbon protein
MENINNSQDTRQNNTKNLIIIILSVVLVALVINNFRLSISKGEIEKELDKTASEKLSVSNDLQKMYTDYESLKTSNDTMNARLGKEQERIKKLMEELKTVKYSNAAEISRYKNEVDALRRIMKSYIVQLDSLNTANQSLMAENHQVRSDFRKIKDDYQVLTSEKEVLNTKVKKAEALSGENFLAKAITDKGKDAAKAKKAEKIQVCFRVKDNAIAAAGNRQIFVRISRPDGFVMALSKDDLFEFQGQEIVFSAKKDLNYSGKAEDVCVYFKPNEALTPGKYSADVFAEGNQIGTADFELK